MKHTIQFASCLRRTMMIVGLSAAWVMSINAFGQAVSQPFNTSAQSPTKPVGTPMRTVAPSPDARVIAEPAGLDFGVVAPHTVLEGNFKLINTSDKPLKVLGAQPSCQCTTIDIVGKEILARASLEVPVTMKVSATGIKTAQVKVVVEGEAKPIQLDLRAEVAYAVRLAIADASGKLQPYIDAADDASRLKGVVQVLSSDSQPLRVLSIQGQKPIFVDWNPEVDAPRSQYQVRFALQDAPCEQVPKYMLVETDRADARIIDARVRHACTRISPALDIAEFRCNAGVIATGGTATFDIEIKKMGSNRIASVKAVDEKFEAQLIGQRTDGNSLMVTIGLKPSKEVSGIFLTSVLLSAVDVNGQPYQTQRPEAAAAGQSAVVITKPSQVDLLVYGKVE